MLDSEHYEGNVQTWVKHQMLTSYLRRLAFKVGSFVEDFVYVDGFSGPWKSKDQELRDTSPYLALQELAKAREGLAGIRKHPRFRALFVEQDPTAFAALEQFLRQREPGGIRAEAHQGRFEDLAPQLLSRLGRAFAFLFIDPTGWSGYPMRTLAPLVAGQRREVLINFMFDFAQRFVHHTADAGIEAQFDELFGDRDWRDQVPEAGDPHREEALVSLYCQRLQDAAGFEYVTHTRILKPHRDQTYFYLIYGTHSLEGLLTFREVEKASMKAQEELRADDRQRRDSLPGQGVLFAASESLRDHGYSFAQEKARRLEVAKKAVLAALSRGADLPFKGGVLRLALVQPYVWRSDMVAWIQQLEAEQVVTNLDKQPKQRVPHDEDRLRWIGAPDYSAPHA